MCCKGRGEQGPRYPFSHSLPEGARTQRGSSEGSNLDPLRQVAGNVACMVRDVQKVDAVVSGLSTNYVFRLPKRNESDALPNDDKRSAHKANHSCFLRLLYMPLRHHAAA